MTIRTLYTALVILIGIVLIIVGEATLSGIGDIADRTSRAVALVEQDTLRFTTDDDVEVVVPLLSDCKRSAGTGRGCIERFETGDEVLVWYDSADPQRVWQGTTPGGGMATLVLYSGVVLVTAGAVALVYTSGLVRLVQRKGRAPDGDSQKRGAGR